MILEIAQLHVRDGQTALFEAAFASAASILEQSPGYVSHRLERCIENELDYVLLVEWQTLEAHTVGFRGSPAYQRWRTLLHHFYDPPPRVHHFERVAAPT
ncbi:MAG: antibiotic biosynthesis monooxygenase [Burkholderiaceae bacterium]